MTPRGWYHHLGWCLARHRMERGTLLHSWLRHFATNLKVEGSIPDKLIRLFLFWNHKVGLWDHHAVCASVNSAYQLLNAWTNVYEIWYAHHGSWAHLNGVLQVKVILPPTVSRPMTRFLLLSDICGLHIVGRPPWREGRTWTLRPKSHRTRGDSLLSHLRILGYLSVASYNSQGYGGGILARLHFINPSFFYICLFG
jgi:hypothetical protein